MKTIIGIAAMILALGAPDLSGQVLDPNKSPGGNFNLKNFYLGLPVDSSGGTTGNSASIPASQLVAGYSNALYFYTGPDGAMVFWAPVTGATTSGSSYPRSELREQLNPPSNASNWFAYGTHVLTAQCRVAEVPSSGKVIIGQVHGYTGAALPLVKLQYSNGRVEVLIKTNANNDLTDKKFTFSTVGLSNSINYEIRVVNGLVSVAVNGVTNSLDVFQTDPDWATNTLYFKAGSYCQDNTGTTNEGSRVAFYSVTRSHAPAITHQPAGGLVLAGSNSSMSVVAAGNGPLRYQWFFNETNALVNATNASLTISNVLSAQSGGYSVRVADGLGVVTSAVASLVVNRPPLTGNFSAVTGQQVPVSINLSNLLALASDPDGDPLDFAGVVPVSSYGGAVDLSAGVLRYTPPAGFLGTDELAYQLADARGALATGSVAVTVVASNAITLRAIGVSCLQKGTFSARFEAVPGLSYTVDRATNLAGPWELAFTNVVAATNGLLELTDPNAPPESMRFYRTHYP